MSEIPIPPGLGQVANNRTASLRRELEQHAIVVPGITDVITARLVERAGFPAAYVTGAGFANVAFGLPDVGLVSMSDVVAHVDRISAGCRLPLIVDADTGFGDALAVMRTVHLLERAGASAIQIEDQAMPKRCGHFEGHVLVEPEEMVARIQGAKLGRSDPELMIIARTDARGVHGLDEALRRSLAYIAAGADAIFVEAPRSAEELRRIATELPDIPLVVNVVEGGKTPQLPAAELEEIGYRIILRANLVLRTMLVAAQNALASLAAGKEPPADQILGWDERQQLVNLHEFDAIADDLRNTTLREP